MTRIIERMFISHPQSVDESYLEHFGFVLRFSGLLFAAAGAALIHALVPCLFEKTASGIIRKLHTRIANRGN